MAGNKKYYLMVVLFVVAALAVSALLLPGKQEMALMQMKDRHFADALKSYEAQAARGNLSLDNANHLAELYLQAGAVNKAIDIMEKFVAQNPANLEARTKLGTLYQYGGRDEAYIANLEEIQRLNPKSENLKLLSNLYNSRAEYDKQAGALRRLIDAEQGANPEHYKELANVLAAQKAPADGVLALKKLRDTTPAEFGLREEAMLVTLLLDDKRPDEARQEVESWLGSHSDAEHGAALLGILHYHGSPQLAAPLLTHFTDAQINASPELLAQYVQLQLALGQEEEAYRRMRALHSAGRLPEVLRGRLLLVAETRGDTNLVGALLTTTSLTTFDEQELLGLLELAVAHNDITLVAGMTQTFAAESYRTSHPVLVAALAVANAQADTDARLAAAYALPPEFSKQLELARICLRAKHLACVATVTDRLAAMPDLNESQRASIAELYAAQKQPVQAAPAPLRANPPPKPKTAGDYAAELDKRGRYAESRPYWLKVAAAPLATPKERRAVAFLLLNHGYKADAEPLFRALAADAPADSGDVRMLLYLWGPRPDDEQMLWLETRYLNATGSDRARWGEYLATYGSTPFIIDLARDVPDSLDNPAIAQRYLEALLETGGFAQALPSVAATARSSGSTALLRQYAKTAQSYGYKREALQAWEIIASLDPLDDAALREAGFIAYSLADYSSSEIYLSEYLRLDPVRIDADPQSYRAYFVYGQLLRRQKQLEPAKEYYRAALDRLAHTQDTTPEAISIMAQSNVWLGEVDTGLDMFTSAIAARPDNDILRADLVSTLLDLERWGDAREVLATPPDAERILQPMAIHLAMGNTLPIRYLLRDADRELLLQFAAPLPVAEPLSAERVQMLPWISYASQGYDTVLMHAKPGYKFAVDTGSEAPSIHILSDAASPTAELARQILLRYELLTARLDLATGHVYAATTRINDTLPHYPDDPQIMGMLANAENYGGNWPRALQLLKTARKLSPENEDLKRFERDVRRLHAENITLDHEWVKLGASRMHLTTLSGYADATEHMQLGARIQNDHVHASRVRRADGRVGTFSGTRQQYEFYSLLHGENGKQFKASLFADNDRLGAGAQFAFLNPLGESKLTGEWHRPYWEFAETVIDDANRDRIALTHIIKPRHNITLTGEGGLNRYNTEAVQDVLETASAKFDIVYRFADEQPFLAVAYGFDGEYELAQKKAIDATGDYTPLFPLRTREVHFISLNAGYEFTDATYGESLIGYGWDRFGGSGPSIAGKLTHEFNQHWDAQIRAMYGLNASDSSGNTARIGAYVRRRFP